MEENKNGENSDLLGKSARLSFVVVIGCEKHTCIAKYGGTISKHWHVVRFRTEKRVKLELFEFGTFQKKICICHHVKNIFWISLSKIDNKS